MALANSRNNFGLLSSSQEPSQLIAQATNTAKNRKKKEKAKGKKAATIAEHAEGKEKEQGRDSNDIEKQAEPAQQAAPAHNGADLESLQRQFAQDAQKRDCWSVWDEWLRRAKAETKDLKYKDAKGNAYTFQQALSASSALPRSVSNAIYRHMTPSDRDLLTALLNVCLPAVQQSCKQLAAVVSDVSQQLDTASKSTKDAAAASLESALKSFVRACEATADSGMPDLNSLDKEIASKQPLLQKAISQPDTVQTATVDMAMQVVQLLHRRYEGEQCLSYGLAPSICAAAKADTEHLAFILTQHACSASPTPAATMQEPSSSPEVESAITSLTQRIAFLEAELAFLEAELAGARTELREAQALRNRSRKGGKGAAASSRASQSDKVFTAKHAAQRLESIVMEVARLPSGETAKNGTHPGSANSATSDSTLMQLLDFSTHTAQMQDKLMDKLAEQLEFARARLVSASNMKNDSGIANARKLFSNVRAASSETHDSAARLEALVASLENAISSSPSFSTLRPMAMQVKQIAWQVYNSHNHLSANARPDAILEAASNTKGAAAHTITLDEILQMDVSGKNKQQQQQTQSASSGLSVADPTAAASRAATQASSPAPSSAAPLHGNAIGATAPSVPVPIQATMPADNSVHAALVYGAPMPAQQGVGLPPGFPQPVHAMIAQPAVVPVGGALQPQVMVAQPGQTSMPLQQYVPDQLFAQDGGTQMGSAGGPPPGIAAPVPEAAPPSSRFDSQIAAAETAAANLAKVMAAKPAAGRGGRAAGGQRGGGAVRGRR